MVKDVGHVVRGRNIIPLPENTIYQEVTIADLMKQLNLKVVKKMLVCDFAKDPTKSYVASEWENDLKNYASIMLWKGKMLAEISTFLSISFAIKYWLALYKQKDITPQQKEFYKMCTCLVAAGMLDLKPGDNIMENKEGFPVAVDTGFSYFTETYQDKYRLQTWQECVDILKQYDDKEVNKWGELIQSYKNYITGTAEKKAQTIINFVNIIESAEGENKGKKRCEVILPHSKPDAPKSLILTQNKVAPAIEHLRTC